jgi:hypothetical protein
MTIKQLGGVFGRNPTFNDVTIEGQLTFNGDIDIDSDLKVDGDLDVTGTSNLAAIAGTGNVVLGNTITNPASNFANQRGFGWNDSTKVLEISSSVAPLELGRTSGGGDGQLLVFRQATNVAAEIRVEGNAGYFKPYNGGGIDFSATAGAGTSELLDDYEEGAASLTVTSGAGTITTASANAVYTKIGRSVILNGSITITNNGTGSSFLNVAGLPFTPATAAAGVGREGVTNGKTCSLYVSGSSATMQVYAYDNTYPVSTGSIINFTVVYSV